MENTNQAQQKGLTLMEFYDKPTVFEVNGQEVKLTPNIVKTYLTRGNDAVDDQEIIMFISLCKFQKLNPFLNEAYLVKFKGSPAQMITSAEAYMKRAYDCENYDGLEAGIIVQRGNEIVELEGAFMLSTDVLLGGWAKVYVKGKSHPSVAKISFSEFSKGQSTWKSMPATMIRKVAKVNALREAFPKELGSLYIEEEPTFNKGNVVEEVKKDVQEQTGKAQPPKSPQPQGVNPSSTKPPLPTSQVQHPVAPTITNEQADKFFSQGTLIPPEEDDLPFTVPSK